LNTYQYRLAYANSYMQDEMSFPVHRSNSLQPDHTHSLFLFHDFSFGGLLKRVALLGICMLLIADMVLFQKIMKKVSLQPNTFTFMLRGELPALLFAQQQKEQTYTIRFGDDLWHIAEKLYGSGYQWIAIARANNLKNPGLLSVGQELILPSSVDQREEQSPVHQKTYVVQSGDDLWHIAVKLYQNGYQWTKIAQVNHIENPGLIYPQQKLLLPR
jgi:nucleoid-associated protein YgaU